MVTMLERLIVKNNDRNQVTVRVFGADGALLVLAPPDALGLSRKLSRLAQEALVREMGEMSDMILELTEEAE